MSRLQVALLVALLAAASAAAEPDRQQVRFRRQVNLPGLGQQGTGASAGAGAQAGASPDQVAKLLGDIGAQVQKTQTAIQQAAQNWANMFNPNQLANQQVRAPPLPAPISRRKRQASSTSGATDLLAMLADLGPQVERAQSSMKLLKSLFGGGSGGSAPPAAPAPLARQPEPRQLESPQQPIAWQPQPVSQPQLFNMSPPGQPQPQVQPQLQPQIQPSAQLYAAQAGQASGSGSGNGASLMSQLSELIRATQSQNAKLVANSQEVAPAPVQSAQTGIQGALIEMGQGLKRIALNNPSLIPDIKHLYQSVSSRLSSVSGSLAPQKSGQEQLAENLAKEFSMPS